MVANVQISRHELDEFFHQERERMGLPCLRTLFKYCPQFPTPTQLDAIDYRGRELLIGGEAGSAKSSALGMIPLQYLDIPGFKALILRVNKRDFFKESGLATRVEGWLAARGNGGGLYDNFIYGEHGKRGGSIEFGHVATVADMDRYLSTEYHIIEFEELTEFNLPDDPEMRNPLTWLNRSLRASDENNIPLRIVSATNPGSRSHNYVKNRYLTDEIIDRIRDTRTRELFHISREEHKERAYLHAYAEDNPYINIVSYHAGLDLLDTVSRARQKFGDWSIRDNSVIMPGWFRYHKIVDGTVYLLARDRQTVLESFELADCHIFGSCDAAGTSQDVVNQQKGKRSSYTAIGIWARPPQRIGNFLICLHVTRKRLSIPEIRDELLKLNQEYRPARIVVENEKFGKSITQLLKNRIPIKEVGHGGKDKATRAVPLIDAMEKGCVFYPHHEPAWLKPYVNELIGWTGHPDDISDQIDMSAYAAQEVFVAEPPIWSPLYFGINFRHNDLPTNADRWGLGIAPCRDDTDGVSAIVQVARAKGKIYVDAHLGVMSPDEAVESLMEFADPQPHCVLVDREYRHLVRSKMPWLGSQGYRGMVRTRNLPEKDEDIKQFFDSGIREGIFSYRLTEGGNALVSRLSSYPGHQDPSAIRALYLAVKSLAVAP